MLGGRPHGRLWNVCLLMAGLSAAGATGVVGPACSHDDSSDTVPEVGQLELDLVATGASGAQYRLRNAVFEILALTSGETIIVSSEDDLAAATIELELQPDAYLVFLLPGYYLEQISDPNGAGGEGGGAGTGASSTGLARLSDTLAYRSSHPARKLPVRSTRTQPLAELPQVVDAELVSENPVLTQVVGGERSFVEFVFALEGQGNGELGIGVRVLEPGSSTCQADSYEPNDTPEEAALVSFEPPLSATACQGDDDFYLFDAPVPSGEAFQVHLEFSHALGDIDAVLFNQEGSVVSAGVSVTDDELLVTTSNGGSYFLLVYTLGGNNDYTVSAGPSEVEQSNCCAVSPLPGCADPAVNSCVCELDAYCCEVAFDELCVQQALGECGGSCPLGEGSCCETSDAPGCNDADVQNCLCAIDVQCCSDSYDDLCVQQAIASCGLGCEQPAPDSDCCTPGENPSCTDPAIAECTCAVDPLCCAAPFDENCVALATDLCGAECGGL